MSEETLGSNQPHLSFFTDFTPKRILRFLLANLIVLFAWAYIFDVGIASAETGSITVTDFQTKYYGLSETFSGGTINYTSFYFYNTSYQYFDYLRLNATGLLSGLSFVNDFESTTGTIVDGGSGDIITWYDKNASSIYYVCVTTCPITSNRFNISVAKNIFANVSHGGGDYANSAAFLTVDRPVLLWYVKPSTNNAATFQYKSETHSQFTDSYAVSYYPLNIFNINITKAGIVNDRWFINSSNGSYTYESTYNKNLIGSFTATYTYGIYVKICIESGYCTPLTAINTTNVFIPASTNPLDYVDGTTGVGIIFDKASYIKTEVANISWVRLNPTPFGFIDYVTLFHPGFDFSKSRFEQMSKWEHLATSPADAGHIKKILDTSGTYEVRFERSCIVCSFENLDYDTATVLEYQPSYIIMNTTQIMKKPANATVLFGVPITNAYFEGLRFSRFNPDVNNYVFEGFTALSTVTTSPSYLTEYNLTVQCNQEGNYLAELISLTSGVVSSLAFKCVAVSNPPTWNITNASLNISKSSYMYGETMTGDYVIDSINFSNYDVYMIFENLDRGVVTMQQRLIDQKSTFWGELSSSQGSISCLGTSGSLLGECTQYNEGVISVLPGNNRIKLYGVNSTSGNLTIVYKDFVVSNTDSEGYGLLPSSTSICAGTKFSVTVYNPTTAYLYVYDIEKAKAVRTYLLNISITGQTLPMIIKTPGNYEFRLLKSSDNATKFIFPITIKDCAVAEVLPSYNVKSGSEIIDILIFLATNPFIWVVVITLGIITMVSWLTDKDGLAVIVSAWATLGGGALFGAVPLYIPIGMLLIAIALIAARIINIFNTAGGGQG